MNREMINGIEHDLKKYFRRERKIERLYKILARKNDSISKIQRDIEECNLCAEPIMRSIQYDQERVSGSEPSSPVESAMVRAHNLLDDKLSYLLEEKTMILVEIEDLKNIQMRLGVLLDELSEEDMEIVKLRFREKKTHIQIGRTLNLSKTTVARRRDEIIIWIYGELQQG